MGALATRLGFGAALVALASVVACGGGQGEQGFDPSAGANGGDDAGAPGDDDGGPTLAGDAAVGAHLITLTPSNATIFIDTATQPIAAATQAFSGLLHNGDGTTTDVTGELALSSSDPPVGSFKGPLFTSATALPNGALGVTTLVTGVARGQSGIANLTIVALRQSGDQRDFYFVVPYEAPPTPQKDVLKFGTKLKQVDVAIVQDTTGSMSGSIANLKSNLSKPGGIIDGLKAAIPDVGIAIVEQRDYPVSPYGASTDFPAKVWQTVTTDAATAQAAVNKYTLGNGGDDPESQIPAMYHLLTGNALTWSGGQVPAHTPAPGTEGGVDFRAGSFRVVVQITDAPWHGYTGGNDPNNPPAYNFGAPTYAQLEAAFGQLGAKYVGVVDEDSDRHPHQESDNLSDATQSNVPAAAFGGSCGAGQCCTGFQGAGQAPGGPGGTCRLNFTTQYGNGLDASIVKAIQAISVGASFDVTATPSNDPTNPGGVDATKFIKQLRAMGEGDPASGCPAHATRKSDPTLAYDDVFVAVVTGTPVCFEVVPQTNTIVPPTDKAQFFKALIDVVGLPGKTPLDQRSVLFLVPPKDVGVK